MKTKTTVLCHLFITLAAMTAAILPANLFAAPGDLYEADFSNSAILKFTPDGTQSTFASGSLGLPVALAFDGNGNLFEADANGTIFKFTPDGTKSTFASGLNSPPAWPLTVRQSV